MINTVAFEWALRDILQGRRAIGLGIATLVPALFLLLIFLIEGRISEGDEVAAVLIVAFLLPPLVAVISLIVGGTVLRGPLEDATVLYMLTRPVRRAEIGVARGLAVALVVAVATAVAGFLVAILAGGVGMAFSALPGLLTGGFALGALYGFILSLHRFAIGAVLVHAVVETSLARIPFPRLTQWTISWHAWGGMGQARDAAMEVGALPNDGGFVLVPLLMAVLALALTGYLYHKKAFNLGVAEA